MSYIPQSCLLKWGSSDWDVLAICLVSWTGTSHHGSGVSSKMALLTQINGCFITLILVVCFCVDFNVDGLWILSQAPSEKCSYFEVYKIHLLEQSKYDLIISMSQFGKKTNTDYNVERIEVWN